MRRFRMIAFAAVAAGAGLAGATMLTAQSIHDEQRRAVGDWLVEHVAESNGGRIVRMTHNNDAYNAEYQLAFWPGNEGIVRGAYAGQLNCMGGSSGGIADVGGEAPAAVRAELAEHLAGCEVPPERIEAALQGFERAFALTLDWAGDAAAAAVESAAADSGTDMMMDTNMAMEMNPEDMAMDMDVNATTNMNYTNSTEPQ
jgi:hypothetical protein